MNTNKSSISKMARLMFKNSLTDGKIDEKKVQGVLKGLLSSKKRNVIEILKAYRKMVLHLIDEQTAKVEAGFELSEGEKKLISKLLKKIYHKELDVEFSKNAQLLAGLRVKVGDVIWDASLKGRILALKEIYE